MEKQQKVPMSAFKFFLFCWEPVNGPQHHHASSLSPGDIANQSPHYNVPGTPFSSYALIHENNHVHIHMTTDAKRMMKKKRSYGSLVPCIIIRLLRAAVITNRKITTEMYYLLSNVFTRKCFCTFSPVCVGIII